MATRGKFGRRPQTQPSLANTLVAVAREMENQRDQNLMDAWQKGGLFEGKPVTDDMVLAHWDEKMKHVAKNDPLYDTYSETHTQLQYTIANSKISTRYAQGKVSAAAMAAFYTNWAKKIPRDSEFHRVLERNAAQFANSLRGRGGGGGGRGGGRPATKDQLAQIHNEVPGAYLTEALTQVARSQLVIAGDEGLDKVRLGIDENDPGAMVAIIDEMNSNPQFAEYKKEVMKVLHSLNGDIPATGDISLPMYTNLLKTQSGSIDHRAWKALASGEVSTYNSLVKQRDKVDGLRRQSAAWSPTDRYFRARQDFLRVWNSPTEAPGGKLEAAKAYQSVLGDLMVGAASRGDEPQRVSLDSEIRALGGDTTNLKPTIFEDFTTNSGAATYNNENSDAHGTAIDVRSFTAVDEAVKAGTMFYTYGTQGSGGFTAKSGGPVIGAIDSRYLSQDPEAYKAMPVPGTNGINTVYTQGAPIMGVTAQPDPTAYGYVKPLDGGPKPPDPVRIGTAYDMRIGDQILRVYGVPQGDGTELYTSDPPWAQGVAENFNQVSMDGHDVVVVNVPKGMGSPYGFYDPASVKRTGVRPEGFYLTPYVAAASATPEGQASLGKMYANPGAVMQYVQSQFVGPNGPDQAKANAAYLEVLGAGKAFAAPEPPSYSHEGSRPGEAVAPVGNTQNPYERTSGLPALTGWQADYAARNGMAPLVPETTKAVPAIRLPGVDPMYGGLGTDAVIPPHTVPVRPPSVLPLPVPLPPPPRPRVVIPTAPPVPKPTYAPPPSQRDTNWGYVPPPPPKPTYAPPPSQRDTNW